MRKHRPFTICGNCEEIRYALHDAALKGEKTDSLMYMKREHLEIVSSERIDYQGVVTVRGLNPSDYLSIIANRVDQSAFGLLHHIVHNKFIRCHTMKVKLTGSIQHEHQNVLCLYSMTGKQEWGKSHCRDSSWPFD